MKFALVVLTVVAAVQAQYGGDLFSNRQYDPFNRFQNRPKQYSGYPTPYRQYTPVVPTSFPVPSTIAPFRASTPAPIPIAAKATYDDRTASIVRSVNEINPDGSYIYLYETNNGIAAQEKGTPRDFGGNPPVAPVVSEGSFSWQSPEGVPIAISYTADENGYQPRGDAIPTSPPIPEPILRSLEYIARYNKQ